MRPADGRLTTATARPPSGRNFSCANRRACFTIHRVSTARFSAAKKLGVPLLAAAGLLGLWLWLGPAGGGNPIRRTLAAMQAAKGGHRQSLADLRGQLARLPRAQAAKAIRDFLEDGADQATGLDFAVGGDGWLKSAPTLRVFLLDYLAQVDPAAAADYARTVLARSASADEWAVCLRNLARQSASPADQDYLESKFRELARHESWQKSPSVGYLEAFDLPVYLGRTNLAPDLAALLQKQDNQAVAHAAFLALDRLVIAKPADTLALLQASPSLLQGREVTRANFFARADVQDARQRQLLEAYLLNPGLTAAELEKFAGLYPNANYMVSENLLTRAETPAGGTIIRRDAAALGVVNQWLLEPRFESRKPQLQRIQKRLEEFVRQGGKN
jgi:hypothetical protein